MVVKGLEKIADPSRRRFAETAVREGMASYRPEYRAPNVDFTTGGGVESMSANYEKTGVRIGTDKIQIHPNYVEHRADRMAHMVRHENAHRAVEVLQSKVEAREGRDAALAWRERVNRAAVEWMTSALDEAPNDLRLEYGRLHRKFAEQQTRGHGSPPDEAFADLVGYLAAGESMPGDTSPVLALIHEAEPGGIFTGDLTRGVSGRTIGRGGTDGGVPGTNLSTERSEGAQDRRLPVPPSNVSPQGGRARKVTSGGKLQPDVAGEELTALTTASRQAGRALPPGQRKAVDQWVGGKGMVRKIQTGQVSDETLTNFDDAMRGMPRVDGLVYRAVNPSGESAAFAANLKPGQTIELGSPVSTSIDPRKSGGFGTNLYEIESPDGTAYVGGVGAAHAYEKEAVLAPGRFEVVSVDQVSLGLGKHTAPVLVVRLRDTTPAGDRSWKPSGGGDFRLAESAPSSSQPRQGRTPGGVSLDTSRVPMKDGGMTETPTAAGPVPKVTGYVKGREIRPGMVINAADLLPMHERQGATTGENPNPSGHQQWIRVGMIGNSNTPGFKEYEGGGTLTGGMYIVVDQSGRPVGRMSANTIAETTDLPTVHEAQINQVRMPVKVRDKRTDEIRDSFTVVGVPSRHAQEELGLPAPRFLREGVLDPNDPSYGVNGDHPKGTKQPFGGHVQGTRTREEAAADRTRRREVYAAGEEERARRLAEEKARKREEDAAQQAKQREETDKRIAEDREQRRRKFLRDRHQVLRGIIDAGGRERYDYEQRKDVFNSDVDGLLRAEIKSYRGAINDLARAYDVKWRGKNDDEKIDAIIAAVKANKTPNEEVDAPKVKAPVDEAAKATAAAKRRRAAITKDFDQLKGYLDAGDESNASFHLRVLMSDSAVARLAEAFGFGELSGKLLREALFEAIRAGRTPDLG